MLAGVSVDFVAVLVASIAAYIFGFVWHVALGKEWARLSGMTPAKMKAMGKFMARGYVAQFVLTVIMAFVLAHTLAFSGAETSIEASIGAFWIWLGFVATVMVSGVFWKGEPVKLFAINSGFYLISLVIMANIILMMPPLF